MQPLSGSGAHIFWRQCYASLPALSEPLPEIRLWCRSGHPFPDLSPDSEAAFHSGPMQRYHRCPYVPPIRSYTPAVLSPGLLQGRHFAPALPFLTIPGILYLPKRLPALWSKDHHRPEQFPKASFPDQSMAHTYAELAFVQYNTYRLFPQLLR